MNRVLSILFLIFVLFTVHAQEADTDVGNEELARAIASKIQTFIQSKAIHSLLGVKTMDDAGNGITLIVEYFGKKNEKGELISLASFLQPSSIKGTRFLVHQNLEGNDSQWIYLPATKQVARIATSSKQQEFMGTGFTLEDLSSRNVSLFNYQILAVEELREHTCWKLEITPKEGVDWIYSKVIDWVAQETYIPIRTEFYDAKTKDLLKINDIRNIQNIQGYWTIMESELKQVKTNQRTMIKQAKIEYDVEIPDRLFTPGYLKSGKF